MYNKFKNIRIIGLIVIALCIIVFWAANVRIQSVNDYKKSNNDAIIGQNVETKEAGITKDRDDNAESSSDIINNDISQTQSNIEPDSGEPYIRESYNIEDGISGSGESDTGGNKTENDEGNTAGNTGSNGDNNSGNKGDDKPSEPIVTCTIEIRCDNASMNKDKVTNPGTLQYIPDDGTILAVTSYSAVAGYTVYDVLADVARANDIPISATYDKSYVISINNLSEKAIDVRTDKTKPNTSGWTYRVNGELVMLSASKCTVKDGDVIKWIYVCQWGDS